ncbi:MAG: LysR substrate-binding domain-containing protein [Rhodoferax sp.]|uniref:LysR substrate-binding domain-containing protein n=1 Tax=Rhodoferax sp. TaxID=50421 RepID=UPI0032652D31
MHKRLPPLNALRVFAAAARTESFMQACESLYVTQGAVSRQIKQLEEWLGVPVFTRTHRGVQLTPAGRQLSTAVDTAFQHIETVVQNLQHHNLRQQLAINLPPTFATRWMAPRLPDFRRQFAHIDLSISTHDVHALRDVRHCDCVIAFSDQAWADGDCSLLMVEQHVMLASPVLWVDTQPPRLEDATLLHITDGNVRMPMWEQWCAAQGLTEVNPKPGLSFSTLDQVINAALAGAGVAIVDEAMVPKELAAGSLRHLSDVKVAGPHGYWFVNLARDADSRALVGLFRDWLASQFAPA